ncbi:hypothetical protein LD125_00442 [Mesoplasma sp. JKS002658]|uniref:hypothetical protein n=2 Tax=Mesoplasma whartonense TaxID=2878854 RepID=UPI002022ADA8|nr:MULTISPECIES: hypothetical protein [unclassified Mesoplasma]MCL8214777.1 hypothetical protein [Mesoplasma sp. JKS002663]MCL8211440.1 hypothetical protein [Mesoplasma sp. JKS002664]MCL8212292.1 hypothetical protein [Mesoplasma sp. JKS002662]MCL8212448.1 hypothetical protein [Mesoplasma sp. JKS002661]MCL8213439.1 hypothetical protein [Mesoplasma sp. JKS002660]
MLTPANVMENLYEIKDFSELVVAASNYEDPVFVIFSDWYKTPYSPLLDKNLQTSIQYWPDSMLLDLWNPDTTHNSKGVIVLFERVEAIINLQSFQANLKEYGIDLKTFVVEKQEAAFFDKQNRPAREIDPERLKELEEKRKAVEERNKQFEYDIEKNQDKYDILFSYLGYMAALFLQKELFVVDKWQEKFKSLTPLAIQRYFFANLMWIFINDKNSLAKTLGIDLSSAKIKYIYAEFLYAYTQNYFENDYKIVFDKNTPDFTHHRRLMLLMYRYQDYFESEILQQALEPVTSDFFNHIDGFIQALNDQGLAFVIEQDALIAPTAKASERTDSKNALDNLQYFIKGYVDQVHEIISAYNLSVKHRKE